jgi:hypothetical protein
MAIKGCKLKDTKLNFFPELNIDSLTGLILSLQKDNGDIPWYEEGKTDPWDLVEAIMGLNIGAYFEASHLGFNWLRKMQNQDGSWFSSYIDGKPLDKTRESHMAGYISVGLFHTWLIEGNISLLKEMWPVMKKATDFSISLQTETGEIYWARSPEYKVDPMALLTSSSSIYMSLKCALSIARLLGKKCPLWERAFEKLGYSIWENIHNYNVSKSRFSMYWFYPVLSGALTGEKAENRIKKYWKKYVIDGQGVRCVTDQPWVTIAETSELVLALHALGWSEKAEIVFSWIQDRIYEDKSFWCGYTYPDMVIWPEEKISWTNAVALMAADALYDLTPASRLFSHESWDGFFYRGENRSPHK